MTATLELLELRRRVASELTTAGSGPQVKAGVQSMAELPLPLNQKYLSIDAAAIVRGNTVGDGRAQVMERMGRLVKALNVLEKYGLNLHNLARPRYWRSVKHNNPIFKAQVDSMQGGRGILYLYGYTVQQVDGLVFPDDVLQPDRDKVAAVTLEVTCLRLELEMLIKGNHPNPDFLKTSSHWSFQRSSSRGTRRWRPPPLTDVNRSTALPPKPISPAPPTPPQPPLPAPVQNPPPPPHWNPPSSLDFDQSPYTTPPSSPPTSPPPTSPQPTSPPPPPPPGPPP
ncbi:protein diaphanous homolog 1-like [Gadus macrocephalus]|uniref:protein diaphanous homolog 1-like n=1 Tax=Gadus macrocephalus TaxID=80720 RepID=UPI0028CB629F|nr:protein diaphanous homolog 1-like [Gadus macrocephalus]